MIAKNGQEELVSLEAETLALPHVRHGFFTRHGGVSKGGYTSLNGKDGTDDPAHVQENRARIAHHLSCPHLVIPNQTHGNHAIHLTKTPPKPPTADALITSTPHLAIGVVTADCAPVLFASPTHPTIAVAHVGWRGLLNKILHATIQTLHIPPAALCAAVGPCISQEAYDVGEDVYEHFCTQEPSLSTSFARHSQRWHFDLPRAVEHQLHQLQIGHVSRLKNCTFKEKRFFSHRRSHGHPHGHQVSAIALVPTDC